MKDIKEEMFLPSESEHSREESIYLEVIRQGASGDASISGCMRWSEPLARLPQNLFFIELNGLRLVGRKLISPLKRAGQLLELNCSRILPEMILGQSLGFEVFDDRIDVFFRPLPAGQRRQLFEQMRENPLTNIEFPFVYVDSSRKERSSPPEGWALDPTRAENLGVGERHIRNFTTSWLSQFDMRDKVVFDPACSTGEFLASIKSRFPDCIVVGQDLSRQMIDYAKPRVDLAIVGNAIKPGVDDESCDFIFIRFLNSEVVTRSTAYEIFPELVKKLKRNGTLVVFGHTPVLLSAAAFELYGLYPIRCSAWDTETGALFQYYVLRIAD